MQPLESHVRHRLAEYRRTLGPRVASLLDDLLRRLKFDREGSYFLGPAAQPVLQLPGWVDHSGEPVGEDVVAATVEAAAMGYLHVRVQDDFMDEGVGEAAAVMVLSDGLFGRHQALLAQIAGDHAEFWGLFEELWAGYGEGSLLERELFARGSGYDEEAFGAVVRRSFPLMLPGAAVLVRQGRWDEIAQLRGFVEALVAAHQRFHDLVEAEKDEDLGNATFVVQRFGRGEGRGALRRRLFLEGGFDVVVGEVLGDLGRARDRAWAMGMDAAVAFVDDRSELVVRTQHDVFHALFEQILASGSGEPEE